MFRKLFRKTPLAWLQVRREKTRLAVALAGIAFADVLMFVQLGLNDALYDSAANFHNTLRGDLFLINPQSEAVQSFKSFSTERLYQAAAFEGVKSINSLYVGSAQWRNPQNHQSEHTVLTLGMNPAKPAFTLPEVNQQIDKLKPLNRVLYDRAERPEFGDIPALFEQSSPLLIQVKDKHIWVTGLL